MTVPVPKIHISPIGFRVNALYLTNVELMVWDEGRSSMCGFVTGANVVGNDCRVFIPVPSQDSSYLQRPPLRCHCGHAIPQALRHPAGASGLDIRHEVGACRVPILGVEVGHFRHEVEGWPRSSRRLRSFALQFA